MIAENLKTENVCKLHWSIFWAETSVGESTNRVIIKSCSFVDAVLLLQLCTLVQQYRCMSARFWYSSFWDQTNGTRVHFALLLGTIRLWTALGPSSWLSKKISLKRWFRGKNERLNMVLCGAKNQTQPRNVVALQPVKPNFHCFFYEILREKDL